MTVLEEWCESFRLYGDLLASTYRDAADVVARVQADEREAGESVTDGEAIAGALADAFAARERQ